MKRVLLFLGLLTLITTSTKAQWYGRFVDVPTTGNEHTEYRVINFPNRKIFTSRDSMMFRFYVDSIVFNNLIGRNEGTPSKLLWIDNNGLLHTSTAPYLLGVDTISLSNRINLKLNISDTTNQWSPKGLYLFPNDTINRWAPRGSYIYPSDTSVLLPKSLANTLYQLKGTYLLPADTVNRWSPKGLYIYPSDTSVFLPKSLAVALYQPKGSYLVPSDTIGKWSPAGLYIHPGDTSSMLSPYLRKGDTASLSNRINLKLNIVDTTNKWAPKGLYLFPSDTSNRWAAKGIYIYPSDTLNKWAPKGVYIFPADTVNKWVNLNGVYTNPSFVGSLAYSKLTGTPTIPSTTSQISEGSNLYYTDARARSSISLTTTGTTGASTYNSSTGILNIPIYTSYIDYVDSAVVAGGAGNATFYLTNNHTSGGTALYTNVSYVNPIINDASLNYSYAWTVSGDKKTLTVNAKAAVGINVALVGLTLLGVPSNVPNGTKIYVLVKGN